MSNFVSSYRRFRASPSSRNGIGAVSSAVRSAMACVLALLCVQPTNLPTCSAQEQAGNKTARADSSFDMPKRLRDYFEGMSVAKPFVVREGADFEKHRNDLRDFILDCVGLQPLPERVPLDVRMSEPLDHPWCTVRRVSYQLWPNVYSTGLLFMPKQFAERPAPAVLCPHGHWQNGSAHPTVQTRCLNLARLGYVVFSSTQHHYEDLEVGVSHQTLMIWNNVRALDYLASLSEVDRQRIGVAGTSGGGLQTQMLVALDLRVKVATIVGLTCDFRQIMFPDSSHCTCNHFPNVMRRTDHPEISTLGLPCPVQYLTMNDWTRQFETQNFPTIQELYAAHGCGDRVFCRYFATDHDYDRPKREVTYWWLDRWLRGCQDADPQPEPETKTLPVEEVANLSVDQPQDKGFGEISHIFRKERSVAAAEISNAIDWRQYRTRMTGVLRDLLGEATALPTREQSVSDAITTEADLIIQRVAYPSEGSLVVPAWILRPKKSPARRLPVEILVDALGRDKLLEQAGDASPRARARRGALVVLPDVRTFGESSSTGSSNPGSQATAWQRNGIVWGRPVAGMAVTDLKAVLDSVAARPDADMEQVSVTANGSGDLAAACLFAMILDPRIADADLDFAGSCYEKRNLMVVPRVLLYGDVLEWSVLAADRRVTLRNLPPEAGEAGRLKPVLECLGNPGGVEVVKR